MKVWVLETWNQYEPGAILGVYATEAACEAEWRRLEFRPKDAPERRKYNAERFDYNAFDVVPSGADRVLRAVYVWCAMAAAIDRDRGERRLAGGYGPGER